MTELPKAVCALIVRADGKVLGVSRKDDPEDFGLPGGKVEDQDADLRAALERELYEETGLEVQAILGGTHVFEAENGGHLCYTYWTCPVGIDNNGTNRWPVIPKNCELPIDFDAEAGVVKWVDPSDLMGGTFGKYNQALFGMLDRGPSQIPPESL